MLSCMLAQMRLQRWNALTLLNDTILFRSSCPVPESVSLATFAVLSEVQMPTKDSLPVDITVLIKKASGLQSISWTPNEPLYGLVMSNQRSVDL